MSSNQAGSIVTSSDLWQAQQEWEDEEIVYMSGYPDDNPKTAYGEAKPKMSDTPTVDPVTAEVVRGTMETVCFEMATYVSRTATTPILNQSNERNATILDRNGLRPLTDPRERCVIDTCGSTTMSRPARTLPTNVELTSTVASWVTAQNTLHA